MIKLIILSIIISLTNILAQTSIDLFVSSNINPDCHTCSNTEICDQMQCNGSYLYPFDSFIDMLETYQFQDDQEYNIFFLGNESTQHYIILYEDGYYDYRTQNNNFLQNFNNISLTLKPVFCDDQTHDNYGISNTDCLSQSSEAITIYMKSIDFSIKISGSLTIQNLIFNGIDLFYSPSDPCMSSRTLCCFDQEASNTNCYPTSIILTIDPNNMFNGIFELINSDSTTSNTVNIENSIFENINSLANTNLLTLSSIFILNTINCTFTDIYFPYGIISNKVGASTSSSINIISISLSNYNPFAIFSSSIISPLEGYFINLMNNFSGSISIINSTFSNMTNSYMQVSCTISIMFPVVDTQEPYMQNSNIKQFINYGSYSTGIITISSLSGTLTLQGNQFTNIAGYSGTVLVIMNLVNSSVNIISNIFSNNLAIVNTASIKIYQAPNNGNFANSIYCQPITLRNNTFTNNIGCPGASGNVILYCDIQGDETQFLNPETTSSAQLANFNAFLNSNSVVVNIQNNNFISNNLVYSNGILIYGFNGISISNNNFKNNGAQNASISSIFSYQNLGQNITNIWSSSSSSFTWQSTSSLFISVSTNLNISNNTFDNNWAINGYTTLHGSQITIDKIILIGSSFQLFNNTFQNNGISQPFSLASNAYTSVPLISLNMANISNYLSTIQNPVTSQIMVEQCNFVNNTFNYTIPYSFQQIFSSNLNDYVAFIRIYDENERNIANSDGENIVNDLQVILLVMNCTFSSNIFLSTLSSGSFFFVNNIIQNLTIAYSTFSLNQIVWTQVTINDSPGFIFPSSPSMIGVWNNMKTNGLAISISVTNCNFISNTGTIFSAGIDPGQPMGLISSSNIFQNNNNSPWNNGTLIFWDSYNIQLIMNNNIFNYTNNYDYIMLFSKGPLIYNENNNIYGNNYLNLGIKLLDYTDGYNGIINYASLNAIYINNTILTSNSISNIDTTSAILCSSIYNTIINYTEQNSIFQNINNIQVIFYFANQVNFTMINFTLIQNSLSLPQLVYSQNSSIAILNSQFISNTLPDGSTILPYVIRAINNSNISLKNVIFTKFINIIQANGSMISLTNISYSSNVTLNTNTYPSILCLENSLATITASEFQFTNILINLTSTNITIDKSNFINSNNNSQSISSLINNQGINSIIMISNSNLQDIISSFIIQSTNLNFLNCFIWGNLDNQGYSFELNTSNLTLVNTKFNNTFGSIIANQISNININNIQYNQGGLLSIINGCNYDITDSEFLNTNLTLQANNSQVSLYAIMIILNQSDLFENAIDPLPFITINNQNLIIQNLIFSQNISPSIQLISSTDTDITILNTTITSYSSLSNNLISTNTFKLPYAISTINGSVSINSVNMSMFLGLLNATNTTISISNVILNANMTLPNLQNPITSYFYPFIFSIVNCVLSIVTSQFQFNNGFMNIYNTNLTINQINLSDSNKQAINTWTTIDHYANNSTIMVTNCNFSGTQTKFILQNGTTFSMTNTIIWGNIPLNPIFLFNIKANQSKILVDNTTYSSNIDGTDDSYSGLFTMIDSIGEITRSSFDLMNTMMNLTSTNITIDLSNFSSSPNSSPISKPIFICYSSKSIIIVSNSYLQDIISNFMVISTSLSLLNNSIFGNLQSNSYSFILNGSNLVFEAMQFTKTFGQIISTNQSNIRIKNGQYNCGGLLSTIDESNFDVESVEIINTNFSLSSVNSNVNLKNVEMILNESKLFGDVLTAPAFISINEGVLIIDNLTFSQNLSPVIQLIFLEDASMTLSNSNLQSLPIISSSISTSLLTSLYGFKASNSTINIQNLNIPMFLGMIQADESMISIENLNFSPSLLWSPSSNQINQYLCPTVFNFRLTKLTISKSKFNFKNYTLLNLESANININNSIISDSTGILGTNWFSTSYQALNSTIIINNTNFLNINSQFSLNSTNIEICNSNINGNMKNPSYTFNLYGSSLTSINTIINNAYGIINSNALANINIINTQYNFGSISFAVDHSTYMIQDSLLIYTNFTMQASNSNLNIMNVTLSHDSDRLPNQINLVDVNLNFGINTIKSSLTINNSVFDLSSITSSVTDNENSIFHYIISKNDNLVIDNLTMIRITFPPREFILVKNGVMAFSNSYLGSYPIIDYNSIDGQSIISPYAITSINSLLTIQNILITMFMGILNATNTSATIAEMSANGNFSISLSYLLLNIYTSSSLFNSRNSNINITNSSFNTSNVFIISNLSTITIDNCNLGDLNKNPSISWVTYAYQGINSMLIINNSNIADFMTTFLINVSNVSLIQTSIWGLLNSTSYLFDVNYSNLSLSGVIVNNVIGFINTNYSSIITDNFVDLEGEFNLNIFNTEWKANSANFKDSKLFINCTLCEIILENIVLNQTKNLGSNIILQNSLLKISMTQIIDNFGLIKLYNSQAIFDGVTLSGSGPYSNSGGMTINSTNNANIYFNKCSMINNYGSIIISNNSSLNITNHIITETLDQATNQNNEFDSTSTGTKNLFIINDSTMLIDNMNLLTSFGIISSSTSLITIKNSNFKGNLSSLQNNNDVFITVFHSKVYLMNNSFMNFHTTNGLINLTGSQIINIKSIIFENNIIIDSFILHISILRDTVLDSITYKNNILTNSKSIIIITANINQINLINSNFSDTGDISSYHLYFKSHNGITNIQNCIFTGSILSLYFGAINELSIDNINIIDNALKEITNLSTPHHLIKFENNAKISLYNSLFSGLVTYIGAIYFYLLSRNSLLIDNCTFMNNLALHGAAFEIEFYGNNSVGIVNNSKFLNNSAIIVENLQDSSINKPGFGGSIFHKCENNILCNLTILNTIFENNSAEVSAAAIYNDYFPPFFDIKTTKFINNTASFNSDVSSDTVQFMILDNTSTLNNTSSYDWQSLYFNNTSKRILSSSSLFTEMISGDTIPSLVTIQTLDIYMQPAYADNTTTLGITFMDPEYNPSTYDSDRVPNREPITNVTIMNAKKGLINYAYIYFIFWPGSNITAKFSFTGLTNIPNYILSNTNPEKLQQMKGETEFRFRFRNCIMGEVFSDNGACIPCGEGFYSVSMTNNTRSSCNDCDFMKQYCFGKSMIAPRKGYWRKNETANLILKCPNLDSCLGNINNVSSYHPSGKCIDSRNGNLCNNCPPNYINHQNTCINCLTNAWYYIQLVIALIVQIGLMCISINSVSKSLVIANDPNIQNRSQKMILATGALKILINFFQVATIIKQFDIEWPFQLSSFFKVSDVITGNTNQYFSFSCLIIFLFPGMKNNHVYIKSLVLFLMPILFSLLGILIWILIYLKQRKPIFCHPEFNKDLIVTLLIIGFNIQPNLINNSFSLFQCANLYRSDLPEYYLHSDYEILCFDGDHNWKSMVLGIPNFLLWGIVFPLSIFLYLRKNRFNLDSQQVKEKFLFLYKGYKKRKYYWEIILMFKKILLIIILVFGKFFHPSLQTWLLLILIFGSLILQLKNSPIIEYELSILEEKSQYCILIICLSAMYYSSGIKLLAIDYLILVICILVNMWFIYQWLMYYVKLQIQIHRMKFAPKEILKIIGQTAIQGCVRPSNDIQIADQNLNFLDINTLRTHNNFPTTHHSKQASITTKRFNFYTDDSRDKFISTNQNESFSHISSYKKTNPNEESSNVFKKIQLEHDESSCDIYNTSINDSHTHPYTTINTFSAKKMLFPRNETEASH